MPKSERESRSADDGGASHRNHAWVFVLIVALLLIGLSLDGKHYWHEVRFVYVATQFSLEDALAGVFNPHQAGGPIDELGAAGFYSTKLLHIFLLKAWFRLMAPDAGGFVLACFGSLLAMLATIMIFFDFFRRLHLPDLEPRWGLVCLLVAPITPYLAGKLLSEVTSLLFLAGALWAFLVGLQSRSRLSGLGAMGISTVALVLSALARLDLALSFAGFCLAAALFLPDVGRGRRRIAASGAAVAAIGGLLYTGSLLSLGVDPRALLQYLSSYIALHPKSHVMSLLGLLTVGGLVYLPALVALSQRSRAAKFFGVWWVLAALPMIAITANYMVEPRYLAASLVPLAGLGGVGLSAFWKKKPRRRAVALAAAVIIIAAGNYVLIGLMPFELDRTALLGVVDDVRQRSADAAILVPWAYTDYHFLRVMAQDGQIYNVNTPSGKTSDLADAWRARFRDWYGRGYLDDPRRLREMLAERRAYYVGWRKYPPLQEWILRARGFGFDRWADLLEGIPLQDHIQTSWLWDANGFRLTKEESETARDLGMSEKQYYDNKMLLKKEGRLQ